MSDISNENKTNEVIAVKNAIDGVEIISPDDGYYYFFGYYDLQPFSSDDSKHLCHKVKFMDRMPTKDDVCELGYIDMKTKEFHKLSETTAWNFQQGAMLQWYKDDEHIVYNIRIGDTFHTEILNIVTGEKRILPMAAANISKNGKYALCINFSRIYDFRPGYGYSDVPDEFLNINAPENDGVFLMDMDSGECKLIISYKQLAEKFPEEPFTNFRLVVNHITFNPSGDRFLFLLRNFPTGKVYWKTQLLTSDLEGNVCKLSDYIVNSHYYWKNDRQILIVTSYSGTERFNLCLRDDITGETVMYDYPELHKDIHCIYSPDKRYIIGDAYPDADNYRTVYMLDTKAGKVKPILSDYSYPVPVVDIRSDLHVRWNHTGDMITYDSNHTGKRCICKMNMTNLDK